MGLAVAAAAPYSKPLAKTRLTGTAAEVNFSTRSLLISARYSSPASSSPKLVCVGVRDRCATGWPVQVPPLRVPYWILPLQ